MSDSDEPIRYRIYNLALEFEQPEQALASLAAERLSVPREEIARLQVVKRSMDARGKPTYIYQVDVVLSQPYGRANLPREVRLAPQPPARPEYSPRRAERVAVLGAGPAGLFCARRLAESGLEPILLDRGQPVEQRGRHVSRLMHHGELREDSNICFGEGGAGTWSDGKLYTRVNDRRVDEILETIVALGGPERILTDARPHLGTDKLVALCKAFRADLEDRGAQVRFGCFVEQLVVRDGVLVGLRLRDGELLEVDRLVLAVGHSAREMYRHLAQLGVAMEAKPFAVGFRVEHPQALINSIQYGRWAERMEGLPTADYRLATNYGEGEAHRGVYSFCMCPGGQVVCSATRPEAICVNGMSHASRRGHWANAALVVSVDGRDFGGFGPLEGQEEYDGLLAGMIFQQEAERRAYAEGGGGFYAPAQRLTDFAAGAFSGAELRKTTYKPGVRPGDLARCYPEAVIAHLRDALERFDHKMPGFLSEEALLIGVETRTSAPLRVLRDDEGLQSPSVAGLYPVGEGAGYGGGIVSAAIDGLRVAERILEELSA